MSPQASYPWRTLQRDHAGEPIGLKREFRCKSGERAWLTLDIRVDKSLGAFFGFFGYCRFWIEGHPSRDKDNPWKAVISSAEKLDLMKKAVQFAHIFMKGDEPQ